MAGNPLELEHLLPGGRPGIAFPRHHGASQTADADTQTTRKRGRASETGPAAAKAPSPEPEDAPRVPKRARTRAPTVAATATGQNITGFPAPGASPQVPIGVRSSGCGNGAAPVVLQVPGPAQTEVSPAPIPGGQAQFNCRGPEQAPRVLKQPRSFVRPGSHVPWLETWRNMGTSPWQWESDAPVPQPQKGRRAQGSSAGTPGLVSQEPFARVTEGRRGSARAASADVGLHVGVTAGGVTKPKTGSRGDKAVGNESALAPAKPRRAPGNRKANPARKVPLADKPGRTAPKGNRAGSGRPPLPQGRAPAPTRSMPGRTAKQNLDYPEDDDEVEPVEEAPPVPEPKPSFGRGAASRRQRPHTFDKNPQYPGFAAPGRTATHGDHLAADFIPEDEQEFCDRLHTADPADIFTSFGVSPSPGNPLSIAVPDPTTAPRGDTSSEQGPALYLKGVFPGYPWSLSDVLPHRADPETQPMWRLLEEWHWDVDPCLRYTRPTC